MQPTEQVINRELSTRAIIISGKQRDGKTILGIRLSVDYSRIYANVTILRDGAPIETHLNKLSDFGKIPLMESKGVVLIDEASRIYSARSSLSKANKSVNDFLFLVGKKNCDLIWIAQIEESIDKYARKLCDRSMTVRKYHDYSGRAFFNITVRSGEEILKVVNYDLIKYLSSNGIEYYTTEEGGIEDDSTSARRRKT